MNIPKFLWDSFFIKGRNWFFIFSYSFLSFTGYITVHQMQAASCRTLASDSNPKPIKYHIFTPCNIRDPTKDTATFFVLFYPTTK